MNTITQIITTEIYTIITFISLIMLTLVSMEFKTNRHILLFVSIICLITSITILSTLII